MACMGVYLNFSSDLIEEICVDYLLFGKDFQGDYLLTFSFSRQVDMSEPALSDNLLASSEVSANLKFLDAPALGDKHFFYIGLGYVFGLIV